MHSAGLLFKVLALAAVAVTASAADVGTVSAAAIVPDVTETPEVTTVVPATTPVHTMPPAPTTVAPVATPEATTGKVDPCPPMPPTPSETPVQTMPPTPSETPVQTMPPTPSETPVQTMPPTPSETPVQTMPPVNSTCTILENKDRSGFDLTNIKGKIDSCDKACEATKGCQTWTWNSYNDGTCWLKSYPGKLIDKAGVSATTCIYDTPALVCKAYENIDFVGMDVGDKPAKSVTECCDICSEFNGCTAYAWNSYNGGTCWLKKSVGHVVANVGVTSGSIVQLWGPVCPFEYDTDFEGNDIGNKPAKDAGVCCSLCKGNAACKAYTWSNFNGGTCWMKSAKGKTIQKTGIISAKLA